MWGTARMSALKVFGNIRSNEKSACLLIYSDARMANLTEI